MKNLYYNSNVINWINQVNNSFKEEYMKKTSKKREQNGVKDETVMYKPVKPYKEKQAEDRKNKKKA